MAGVGLLALLALPSRGGLRTLGSLPQCRENFRQLTRAWLLYAEDNAGVLPANLDGGDAQSTASTNTCWAGGWLDFSGAPANTNLDLLANARLGRYLESPSVFRCPADSSLSRGPTGSPRVRSVSMNSYVGKRAAPYTAGFRQFSTLASIANPSPSELLVFLEEREDSINDPCFLIDMNGYDPVQPTRHTLVDYPAARHDGACVVSMADGHVEGWRWTDARTRPPSKFGLQIALGLATPNNADVVRIQNGASRRVGQ